MNYGFFDYKTAIKGYHGQDMFGTVHLCFTVLALAAIAVLCTLTRKIEHRRVERYLKVLSILIPLSEAVKIIWESSYDIAENGSFNWPGLLPLYACSLFIYTLPLAAWTRGRVRECALSFLTTLGIFAGLTNFVYLNILNTYPFFTYATFVSIAFHFLMVFTGIFLVTTGCYRPKLSSLLYGGILFLLYAIPVSFANYFGNAYFRYDYFDYCFLYHGRSCPILLSSLAEAIGPQFRPLYTLIAALSYVIPAALVLGIINLCLWLPAKFRRRQPPCYSVTN